MKERDLERSCKRVLEASFNPVFVWKISDNNSGGMPDTEVSALGATTKMEFKLIKKGENIHDKWEDNRQLITLYTYERTTQRSWVVLWRAANLAYDRGEDETLIYRPSSLLDGKIPAHGKTIRTNLTDVHLKTLWHDGVIRLEGFNHAAIADLIRMTHR